MSHIKSLAGKTALVTGSTSGIGESIMKVLASHGCNIILSGSRAESEVSSLLDTLQNDYPNQKFWYAQVDLSQPKTVAPFFENALKMAENRIHILINNAGVQHISPVHEFDDDNWNRLMNINLNSCFILMREFIAHWRREQKVTGETPWGRIVNISSVHGLVASVNKSAYVASKHALNGLTKVAALELAADTNITVNAVCPGYVMTPLVQRQIERIQKERNMTEEEATEYLVGEKQPTKRFSTGEQVGEYTAFLCSEHAANITGACQSIDGAWSTW